MEAPQGRPFGKYRLVERIGSGGMGEVWKSWDADLSRWVALKLLKSSDPDEEARFEREARTAAQLSHPNIAAVYEVGVVEKRPYIAMQLIEGTTLDRVPRNDRNLLLRLVRDAAIAVHAAHEKGIIHRDLKPANIMVEGESRVFVMDFGLARQVKAESSLTLSGMILGTPSYMSPEQARGQMGRLESRSDVYSIGATLYELLDGSPVFQGSDVMDLLL